MTNRLQNNVTSYSVAEVKAAETLFKILVTWKNGQTDIIDLESIIRQLPDFEIYLDYYYFCKIKIAKEGKGVTWPGKNKLLLTAEDLCVLSREQHFAYYGISSRICKAIHDKESIVFTWDEIYFLQQELNKIVKERDELTEAMTQLCEKEEKAKEAYDANKNKKKGALESAKIMGWNSGKKTKKHHPVQLFIIYKDIVDEKRDSAPITEGIKREALLTMQGIFSFPTFAAVSKAVQIGHAQIKRENPQDTSISGYLPSNFPPPYQDSEK